MLVLRAKPACRRLVEGRFDSAQTTPDNRRLGLIEAINACITDPRDRRYDIHRQRTMLS